MANRQQCPNCGKYADSIAKFCPECGAPLPGSVDVGTPEAVAATPKKGGGLKNWLIGAAVVFVALVILGLLIGDDKDKTTGTEKAAKLQITSALRCESQSVPGIEGCFGTVKNVSDKQINDLKAGVHWLTDDGKPAGDSQLGGVDFSPILPGQESPFYVMTPNKNPAVTKYRVFFFKNSSGEDEYPVTQLDVQKP